MKARLLALLTATAMSVGTAQAADVIFAHGENPGNPRTIAAEKWAELYGACVGAQHKVTVAPAATMGDDAEMLTSAIAGVIQVTANSQGPMSQIVPEISLLGLPFLFKDLPAAWAVVDGEVGQLIDQSAQKAGLKVLGFWDNGIRHVTHISKAIKTPDDIKGMKIRTPPGGMAIDIFQTLGASPAPLAFSELPSALQSGVFDGQENPLVNIHSAKIHTITKHISMTGHMYEATPVVAGLGWWSGLDDATKDCLSSATAEAGKLQRETVKAASDSLRPKMEAEGAIFAEADQAAFQAATQSVYDKYAERFPELVAALRKAAGL